MIHHRNHARLQPVDETRQAKAALSPGSLIPSIIPQAMPIDDVDFEMLEDAAEAMLKSLKASAVRRWEALAAALR